MDFETIPDRFLAYSQPEIYRIPIAPLVLVMSSILAIVVALDGCNCLQIHVELENIIKTEHLGLQNMRLVNQAHNIEESYIWNPIYFG